jgi:hypothetical protein
VPTDTLIRYRPDWEGALLGDKTWTAIFDNSKIKSLVGDFTCSQDLDEILREPLRNSLARIDSGAAYDAELDALFDRIAADQNGLGR